MARGRGRVGGRPKVSVRTKQWRVRQVAARPGATGAIQVDPQIQRVVDELVQSAARKAAIEISTQMLEFFRRVQTDWPRPGHDTSGQSTGYSWGLLGLKIEQVGQAYVATITNGADYARFIAQHVHGRRKTYLRLIFDPADKVAEELALEIASELAE